MLVMGESLVDVVDDGGTVVEHVGGSAANVAVALARLDVRTSLVTRVGDDARGRRVVEHLRRNGVELYDDPLGAVRTSTAVATIGADGAATYAFDLTWDLPPMRIDTVPDALHVCSIGAVLAPGCAVVHEAVTALAGRSTVGYDLNLRPQVTGLDRPVRERIRSLISRTDLVKASDEDLALLHPDRPVDETARGLLADGPVAVLVTRGDRGATWFARDGRTDVAVPPVAVVDTVAAGDTFGAAVLAGLAERGLLGEGSRVRLAALDGQDRTTLLALAAAASAVTVSRAGADPPYRRELPH